MSIFTLFKVFSSKKKARKDKSWLKYFPSVSKLFSIKGIQDSVMDELSPLLKMIFPKTEENVYRTITLVAIINACFAAVPGKMGLGVPIAIALEITMAVAIANHVGLHEVRKENIYKYFGTIATVGFSILVLFKEAVSASFSLFSSFTGPLNPLIPAELLVTNLYGIMFLVGFKEMKKTGSFKIPFKTFNEIYKTTKELTAHQWKFIKKKPVGLLKKCGKKVYAFVTGDVSIKNLNQSEIRGDVFPILATAHLLDNDFESLKGPMGQMFLKAVRLSFPEQLSPNASPSEIAEHLRGYTPEQLHGLINKNIKGKKRLYMTATPKIYGEKAKKKADEGEVALASMDDKNTFGPTFFFRGFNWAVENNILSDYKVVILAVDEEKVNENLQRSFEEGVELKLDDVTKIIGCYKALAKVGFEKDPEKRKKLKPIRRALAFSQSIHIITIPHFRN